MGLKRINIFYTFIILGLNFIFIKETKIMLKVKKKHN